jgi:hypothetical protein
VGERIIKNKEGINVNIGVKRGSNEPRFLKWNFDPLWLYKAELTSIDSPVRYCWVTSRYDFKDFVLQKDNGKDAYSKQLFFLETKGNEFVYQYFSALILRLKKTREDYMISRHLVCLLTLTPPIAIGQLMGVLEW